MDRYCDRCGSDGASEFGEFLDGQMLYICESNDCAKWGDRELRDSESYAREMAHREVDERFGR